jgi:hypothetical protein
MSTVAALAFGLMVSLAALVIEWRAQRSAAGRRSGARAQSNADERRDLGESFEDELWPPWHVAASRWGQHEVGPSTPQLEDLYPFDEWIDIVGRRSNAQRRTNAREPGLRTRRDRELD